MRVALLLVCTLISACERDRDSLGTFDEVRQRAVGACSRARDLADFTAKGIAEFRCSELDAHANWNPECPCAGSFTLRRAANGTDADLLQIRLEHCPHDMAVDGLSYGFEWMFLHPSRESFVKYKADLDEPARGARGASSADAGSISAVRIYGDRVAEIEWSRDAYQQRNGSIDLQPTESYFVAIRPRREGDAERVIVRNDRRVTGVPYCK